MSYLYISGSGGTSYTSTPIVKTLTYMADNSEPSLENRRRYLNAFKKVVSLIDPFAPFQQLIPNVNKGRPKNLKHFLCYG